MNLCQLNFSCKKLFQHFEFIVRPLVVVNTFINFLLLILHFYFINSMFIFYFFLFNQFTLSNFYFLKFLLKIATHIFLN